MNMQQWIRSARQYAKLTQEQLGEHIGVTKGNVSAWENGHHEASVDQINKIAEVTRFPEPLTSTSLAGRPSDGWTGWPFPLIDQKKIRELSKDRIPALEAAILIAAAQVGLDIKK